jgi:NDP-hexose 2,3-enoyl reductase
MDYVHLGRTGLRVSPLCLGTMNFGPVTGRSDSFAVMDHAHEAGINFFDTANVYGWEEKGLTERIIGEWFAQGGARRERTVLATKVYGDMGTWPNDGKLPALSIRRACDASLRRLQTDYIDIYQMHHVDRSTPWDEIWEAMEVLRQQGKVIYVGSSNFAGWHIAQGQEAANRRGVLGLVSEQSVYNLVERTVELEVLPACQAYGLGVIPWSPLHGGLLGGILRKLAAGEVVRRGPGGGATDALEQHRPAIEAWEEFCDERGLGITLDQHALDRLDEIFPGPGGTAPEAYAW